jgi:hypothetical protein
MRNRVYGWEESLRSACSWCYFLPKISVYYVFFYFLSNLCWNPWRGVERPEGLRVVKGDSIPWVVHLEGKRDGGLEFVVRIGC